MNCVHRLKVAEAQSDSRINALLRENGGFEPPVIFIFHKLYRKTNFYSIKLIVLYQTIAPDEPEVTFESMATQSANRQNIDGPKITLDELFSLVRHSKFSTIKEALDYLPNKKFDPTLVQVKYYYYYIIIIIIIIIIPNIL